MIKLNLENAISKDMLQKYSSMVKKASENMENLKSEGFEYLGWKDWPNRYDKLEFKRIIKKVKMLKRQKIEILVVIGIGGSSNGARAGIEMIQGKYRDKMEIIFVGDSLSSTNLAQKLKYVQNKNFAINVISKSGQTLETSIAFRFFRKMLEEKIGLHNASKFIIATTDETQGSLIKIANENEYTIFYIPSNIGGRFSVLTPVGLFPFACAGLNIQKIMNGAQNATKKFNKNNLLENDAYKYAVARFILMKKFPIELMIQYEPQMFWFSEWWKQLVGESEGKNGKGLFPASSIFSTDLHSLGQFIQDGSKVLFETVMTVSKPKLDVNLFEDENNIDNLNYLASKSVNEINKIAFQATTDAHAKVGKVPNIHIEFFGFDEETFGQLIIFFERAIVMTAYLMGVNPFNQPGVEVYKQNMFKQLKKVD